MIPNSASLIPATQDATIDGHIGSPGSSPTNRRNKRAATMDTSASPRSRCLTGEIASDTNSPKTEEELKAKQKTDITLADVAAMLRSLLSLGEVGVCIRLLQSLETSSLGLHQLDGKGGNLTSKFRQFVQSFASTDRQNLRDAGTSFLDRWVTKGPLESQRTRRHRRKARSPGKHDPAKYASGPPGKAQEGDDPDFVVLPKQSMGNESVGVHTDDEPAADRDGSKSPTVQDLIDAYQQVSSHEPKGSSSPHYPKSWRKRGTVSNCLDLGPFDQLPASPNADQGQTEPALVSPVSGQQPVRKAHRSPTRGSKGHKGSKSPTKFPSDIPIQSIPSLLDCVPVAVTDLPWRKPGSRKNSIVETSPKNSKANKIDSNGFGSNSGVSGDRSRGSSKERCDQGPTKPSVSPTQQLPSSSTKQPSAARSRSGSKEQDSGGSDVTTRPVFELNAPQPSFLEKRKQQQKKKNALEMPAQPERSPSKASNRSRASTKSVKSPMLTTGKNRPPEKFNPMLSEARKSSSPPDEESARNSRSPPDGVNPMLSEAKKSSSPPDSPGGHMTILNVSVGNLEPQNAETNNSKVLVSTAFRHIKSEPWNSEDMEDDSPGFTHHISEPLRQADLDDQSQKSLSSSEHTNPESSESSEMSDDSDDLYDDDYALEGSPSTFSRKASMTSMDFDAIEAHEAQWFATSSHIFMVHPNSRYRLIWDTIALLMILTESVTVPLVVGFNVSEPDTWFWLSTIFFTLDITLNFVTGYFRDGLLVMRQSVVVQNYLRQFFIVDFCSLIPWEFMFTSGQECDGASCLVRIVRLLRLFKVRHLVARVEDMFPSNLFSVILNLLAMTTLFVLLCHWSACIWGFIGNPVIMSHPSAGLPPHKYDECEPGGPCEAGLDGSPWLKRYGYEQFSLSTQYLAALHFAVGLVTAQESDIRPGYWGERIYSILLMIISLSVTSAVISVTSVILNKISAGRAEFRERMQFIKEFMRSRKVPIPLQAKVKRYLEYQFKSMRDARAHIGFVEDLSPWIRLELTEHLNKDIVQRHPFFREVPSSIIKHFCARAVTVLYAPGDVIVQRGHRAACMGFIVKGKLRIVSKSRSQQPAGRNSFLEAPCWIGDTSIFVDSVRKFTIISTTHSELLTITKDVVTELLEEFPKLRATYTTFKDMVEQGDFVGCGAQCGHCEQFGHNVADCPKLAMGLVGQLGLPVGVEVPSRRRGLEPVSGQQSWITSFLDKFKSKKKDEVMLLRRSSSVGRQRSGVLSVDPAGLPPPLLVSSSPVPNDIRSWQASPCPENDIARSWQPSPSPCPESDTAHSWQKSPPWQPSPPQQLSPCPPSPAPVAEATENHSLPPKTHSK